MNCDTTIYKCQFVPINGHICGYYSIWNYISVNFFSASTSFFFETTNFIKQLDPCSRRTETGETENTNKRRRI